MGKLVTGTAYAKELPGWVRIFNDRRLPDGYFGTEWTLLLPAKEYVGDDDRPFEAAGLRDAADVSRIRSTAGASAPGPASYAALNASPFGNELLVQAAKAAILAEGLGKDDVPDLLAISFSATDFIEHHFGPYSWEMQDALVRLDKQLADLLSARRRPPAGGRTSWSSSPPTTAARRCPRSGLPPASPPPG